MWDIVVSFFLVRCVNAGCWGAAVHSSSGSFWGCQRARDSMGWPRFGRYGSGRGGAGQEEQAHIYHLCDELRFFRGLSVKPLTHALLFRAIIATRARVSRGALDMDGAGISWPRVGRALINVFEHVYIIGLRPLFVHCGLRGQNKFKFSSPWSGQCVYRNKSLILCRNENKKLCKRVQLQSWFSKHRFLIYFTVDEIGHFVVRATNYSPIMWGLMRHDLSTLALNIYSCLSRKYCWSIFC